MGYRSDVRIVTTRKGYDKLKEYVDEQKNEYNMFDDLGIVKVNSKVAMVGWDFVKWYEDYPEIKAVMDGLNKLEDEKISYSYARMGESYDDYEEFSNEGANEDIDYIPYPSYCRYFDDKELMKEMETLVEKPKDKEAEV